MIDYFSRIKMSKQARDILNEIEVFFNAASHISKIHIKAKKFDILRLALIPSKYDECGQQIPYKDKIIVRGS